MRAGRSRWLWPAGTAALAGLLLFGGSAAAAAAAAPHWTLMTSPDTSTTANNQLQDVSCVSAKFCMAVGDRSNGTTGQALVLKWNGAKWTTVSSPDSSTAKDNELYGVSCVSASFCMAVGYYNNGTANQALVLKWNGAKWTTVSSPDSSTAKDNELQGVSCVSAKFCMAVGHRSNGTTGQTLVLKWNGTKWTTVSSPDSSTAEDNVLQGVSCPSAGSCMASGYNYPAGATQQTLVLRWNGTRWAQVSSPDQGTEDSGLVGVSCLTARFCMATGDSYNGAYQTLALRWNGTKWALVASPGSTNDYLEGVSCPTASFCMAAGENVHGSTPRILMLRWNGTKWAAVSSPDRGTGENYLNGVSCTSASFCLAAGGYQGRSATQTLAERW
jgi:hypothetical protein